MLLIQSSPDIEPAKAGRMALHALTSPMGGKQRSQSTPHAGPVYFSQHMIETMRRWTSGAA
jgi:hypothetical protein